MPAVVKELYFHDQYREPLLMKTPEYYEYGVYVSIQMWTDDVRIGWKLVLGLEAYGPVQIE